MIPLGNTGARPAGPPAGMLAAMSAVRQTLAQPKVAPRPIPGEDTLSGQALYEALGTGDPKADAKLRRIYQDIRQACLEGRPMLERSWWQKLLYVNGRQWIYYSPRGGWQDKRLAKWIPRPVTNIVTETIDSIRAMLTANTPSVRVRPNGNEPLNVITAQTADDLEPVIAEEHQMDRKFFEADFWAPTLGCVWFHPFWNRDDPRHKVFVQAMECPECGQQAHPLDLEDPEAGCQNCGAPGASFTPATNPDGSPAGGDEWLGCGDTDVCSPLEMLVPTYFQRWTDVDRLIRLRWRPKTYYEGRPYFSQIRFSSSTAEQSLQMFRSLAMMSDLTTAPFAWGGATPSRVEGAIEAELWIKPGVEYPEGLWAKAVGGMNGEAVIIRDPERGVVPGPIPYQDNEGKPLWLWVYYPFRETGGRIWAMGALEPIMQKQDQINRNDSMVELIMQRMANPIWLEPKGAEVQRFTGEPGLIVRYSVVAGTNAKPERLEGMNPGQSFFQLRTQYFDDVERLAGTQDVLKGMKPSGVEAFSALNLLVEESRGRFVPILKARGRAYRDWYALAIELERTYGPTERTRSVQGQGGQWTFQLFKKQNLQGAITVVVEDGSNAPKTMLGKRAAMQDGVNLGFINPTDADTRTAGLQVLGIPEMAPGLDAQTKGAQMEQELYEQWVAQGRPPGPPSNPTGNPLMVQAWQTHPVHIQQHDQWATSDRIHALTISDPAATSEITLHRTQHVIASQNPYGLPMAMPPPMAPGPAGPGGPGAPAPAPAGHGTPPAHTNTQTQPPGAGAPRTMPVGAPRPAQGAGVSMANSNREANGVHTLPGNPSGAGNMAQPA